MPEWKTKEHIWRLEWKKDNSRHERGISKDIEILFKNTIEVLKMKSSLSKIKISVERLSCWLDQVEDIIAGFIPDHPNKDKEKKKEVQM
jgi:hypothetical protein